MPEKKIKLAVLGATGHVGGAALDVVRRHRARFEIVALTAGKNRAFLAALCREFKPARAALLARKDAAWLQNALPKKRNGKPAAEVKSGAAALEKAVDEAECVVAATAGVGGLNAIWRAAQNGARLLLANKEPVVLAGDLLRVEAEKSGAALLPVDSEHCALFQLLQGSHARRGLKKVWLTASGGALLGKSQEELKAATPAQALAHPNWTMGKKITVDSATMMNKGLEMIEAAALFGLRPAQIGVVLHRQSIAHALAEYEDGVLTAHFSAPDMRLPLAHMLFWPARAKMGLRPPAWQTLSSLTFAPVRRGQFSCLDIAQDALRAGGGAPAALSAANEVAVDRFLAGDIPFLSIGGVAKKTLLRFIKKPAATLADRLEIDAAARAFAKKIAP